MKVSFVIPIYNHWQLINDLLSDIHNHTRPNEIIIVDDFSNDKKTLDGIAWWESNYENIEILRPPGNLGFLKASNYGVSKATGDIICLISSDVRIETDLAKIVKDLLSVDSKRLIGGIKYTHDTGWNTFDGKTFEYLEGWLLCCTKDVWNELGGFDERYCPSDMEDIDLSTVAKEKGYELYAINIPQIRHLGGGTIGYTDVRMAQTIKNKEKFRIKWTTPKYSPYEEWWRESVFHEDFAKDISQGVTTFSSNMANQSEIEPRTRQDWMERFILWMEFRE